MAIDFQEDAIDFMPEAESPRPLDQSWLNLRPDNNLAQNIVGGILNAPKVAANSIMSLPRNLFVLPGAIEEAVTGRDAEMFVGPNQPIKRLIPNNFFEDRPGEYPAGTTPEQKAYLDAAMAQSPERGNIGMAGFLPPAPVAGPSRTMDVIQAVVRPINQVVSELSGVENLPMLPLAAEAQLARAAALGFGTGMASHAPQSIQDRFAQARAQDVAGDTTGNNIRTLEAGVGSLIDVALPALLARGAASQPRVTPTDVGITETGIRPTEYVDQGVLREGGPEIQRLRERIQPQDTPIIGQKPVPQQVVQPIDFQPSTVEPQFGGTRKAEPLGGQISFNAPAEARAVPSARQAAPEGQLSAGLDPTLLAKQVFKGKEDIQRFAAMNAEQFDKAIKEGGIGVTSSAYRLAETLKTEDIPALEAAQKEAHAQRKEASKAAKTPEAFAQSMALGMKGQMFGEAIKWRQAIDEAIANDTVLTEDFAALERKHGVGESDRFGGDLRQAVEKELSSRSLKDTIAANAKKTTPEFTAIDPTKQQVDVIKSEAVLSSKLGETSHETLGAMTDAELNKVFDARGEGGRVAFSPHTDGVAYGLKHPELLKELEHLRDSASKAMIEAAESGDNAAYKANFGRSTWASGAIEGVKKEGPNYDLFTQNEKAKTLQKEEVESVTALDPASGSPLSATDSLINRLESLKFAEATEVRLYSLPHPDAIAQIGKTAWNNGIEVAIAGIKAGKAVKQAVDDAISYIKKNARNVNETQIRQNLESILREEGSIPAPKSKPGENVVRQGVDKGVEPRGSEAESTRMRNLSARGTQAESVPKAVQEQIANADESFYRQQNVSKVEESVRGMTDQELSGVGKESDIYTAAKLEQANRLFDSGNSEAGYRVFQDLSTELTRLGQVINQAKLLNALRPESVLTVVNEGLKKAGKDVLTPEQSGRVLETSRKRVEAQRTLDKATDDWVKDPSDANAIKAEEALLKSNEASLAEQRLTHKFQDRSMAALLKSILQGNLLTPISQMANIFGNINFLPFRAATRTGAALIDIVDAAIRQRTRQVSVNPVSGTKAGVSGLLKGISQVPSIMTRGMGDTIKGEQRAGLHPLRAWITQLSKNPDAPTVNGRISLLDRAKLAIEGTLGVPAELMLRGLGAGDIAFREAARSRLIDEHSRLRNVPESQRKMASNFPELFFDRETMKRIDEETLGSVFQRHSKTLDHILSWTKSHGDLFDFAIATVAPYKMTPWNIVGEILSYNPVVALGRTAWEAKKGNTRAAEMNAAKMVVGGTTIAAGYWLYSQGLLAPSMDSRDERQKARILAGEVLAPNHINISGIGRAMNGGDPAFKAGDETRDIFRAGGLAGAMFYLAANVGRDMETAPSDESLIGSLAINSTLEQARFGLNQSFLKGVTGLLDAVRDGDADSYLQSYAGTVLSVPLPNTLNSISRAQREYKVDTGGPALTRLENVIRTRLGFTGTDDELPVKRGLWGEPLRERPATANAAVYEFLDITKTRQVTSDPLPLELYRLWRKTADTSVIPSPPGETFTFARTTYNLTPDQRSRYAELIGQNRRSIAERIVLNPRFHSLPDEGKIRMLNRVYDMGLDRGKAQFWMESQGKLETKADKTGFR